MSGEEARVGRRLWGWARRHPWTSVAAGVLVIGGVVFVLVWFQPQALLFDSVVDEDFPTAEGPGDDPGTVTPGAPEDDETAGTDPDGDGSPPAGGPRTLVSGEFTSHARYTVTGTATAYQLEDGSRLLRLEDFESTNGPDLFVYLAATDGTDDDDLARDVVDLGRLRGNVGDQNYDIPDGVDLDRYDTVVIWCRRFTTSFGAADLGA